jgi:hypothetical protein
LIEISKERVDWVIKTFNEKEGWTKESKTDKLNLEYKNTEDA